MKKIAMFCASFTVFIVVFFAVFSENYRGVSLELFSGAKETMTKMTDSFFAFLNQKNLIYENQQLKAQLAETEISSEYKYIKKENEELKAALGVKKKNPQKTVTANVVSLGLEGNFSVTLNRGGRHGISKGDVVVFGNALAGVIQEVFPLYSVFSPVTADGRTTGAMTQKLMPGYVTGSLSLAKENKLRLTFFGETKVKSGDIIVTSGLSDVYPEGLLIGKICSTKDDIMVKTEIDFFKTRIFSVILSH